MQSIRNNIFVEIIIPWVLAFASASLFFGRIITMEYPLTAIIYFALVASLLIFSFNDVFKVFFMDFKWKQYSILTMLLIIHIAIYYMCLTYFKKPTILLQNNNISFLYLNRYFLISKPFEILLQQVFIILLVWKLHQNKLSLKKIILLLAVFFGWIHIFLSFTMSLAFWLYFTIFAILSSIIFPYQIIKIKDGCLYNFLIHLLFYDLSALFFWSLFR